MQAQRAYRERQRQLGLLLVQIPLPARLVRAIDQVAEETRRQPPTIQTRADVIAAALTEIFLG